MKCPICEKRADFWKTFKSNTIDGSGLYKDIIVYHCVYCNHYFNKLSRKDKKYLWDDLENYENRIIADSELNKITLDHIIEHIIDLKKLNKDWDIIQINCPNVSEYVNHGSLHRLYCWLIKTHVHHFSKKSITTLFKDFYLQSYYEYDRPELDNKLLIPSMTAVFTKFNPDGFYYYGAGREFLSNPAFECDGIIDDKLFGKTVNGVKIYKSEISEYLSEKATIKITSWFHRDLMTKKLHDLGFEGNIL